MNADVTLGPVFPKERTEIYAGGYLDVEVGLTAPHLGVFEVQLCANPGARITEDCFVALERDPSDQRWAPYISEAPTLAYMLENQCMKLTDPQAAGRQLVYRFRVPSNVSSEHAIIRWMWQTGNSCSANPSLENLAVVKNFSATFQGVTCGAARSTNGTPCGSRQCPHPSCAGEQFRNCADVRVVAGSGKVTSSSQHTTIPGMPDSGSDNGGSDNGNGGSDNGSDSGNSGNDNGSGGGSDNGSGGGSDNDNGNNGGSDNGNDGGNENGSGGGSDDNHDNDGGTDNGGNGNDNNNNNNGGGSDDTPATGCLTDTADCIANVRSNLSSTFVSYCHGRCNWVSDPSTAYHTVCVQRNICSVLDCVVALETAACTK